MKKIMMNLTAMAMISTSAMAIEGTIDAVRVTDAGAIIVTVKNIDGVIRTKALGGTADAIKAALAVVLTAKSTTAQVVLDGDTTWESVLLK